MIQKRRRPGPSLDELEQGLRAGNRGMLARAITLVESRREEHALMAAELLRRLQDRPATALRLGVTGPPGAGKSTLIDALGCRLVDQGLRVAVLAVDPSSTLSGGSILGDKTRMEQLSQREEAFIRPSPSSGSLGGLARRTRESVRFCEVAGYDLVLIETVGVGQSEVQVRQLCDVFLLLLLAGSGDDLQGIKRGIMELADLHCINKADGDNKAAALKAQSDFSSAVHMLPPLHPGWHPPVLTASAMSGEGLDALWEQVCACHAFLQEAGMLTGMRRDQELYWFEQQLQERVLASFFARPEIAERLPLLKEQVEAGQLPAEFAVHQLLAESDPKS